MINRYRHLEVLAALRAMVIPICGNVHTTSRETVMESSNQFVIIKLPQGIYPYADTHNTAYVQFQLYAKDIGNGVESVSRMEDLIDGICTLFPFHNDLMSCNEKPVLLESKSDGMGYHSCVMQFKIAILV